MSIATEDADRFETAGVTTASSAHFVHDMYTSFLAPLLPVLIENLSLTKTAAGLLSVFYQLPSLIQPLIGHLGDRVNLKILVIVGPTVAAMMMTLLGDRAHLRAAGAAAGSRRVKFRRAALRRAGDRGHAFRKPPGARDELLDGGRGDCRAPSAR